MNAISPLLLFWRGPRREADASFIATYAALSHTMGDDLLAAIKPFMTDDLAIAPGIHLGTGPFA